MVFGCVDGWCRALGGRQTGFPGRGYGWRGFGVEDGLSILLPTYQVYLTADEAATFRILIWLAERPVFHDPFHFEPFQNGSEVSQSVGGLVLNSGWIGLM